MNPHRSRYSLPAVVILCLALPTVVRAQKTADKDLAEIQAYRLSESALAKYTQAARALGKLSTSISTTGEDDGDAGPSTLDAQVAKYDAIPEAKQAIRSAGMTTREYVIFSWSVFEAGMASWGLAQPGGKLPPGVSMDNVTFYRKHEAELKVLGKELEGADSDTEAPEDEGD